MTELGLHGPPPLTPAEHRQTGNLEIVRAAEILYALDERDLLASIYAELGDSGTDVAGLTALAEVAGKHGDAPRHAAARPGRAIPAGCRSIITPIPTVGVPDYKPIAPPIDPAVAYSIARQESAFQPRRSFRSPMPWG